MKRAVVATCAAMVTTGGLLVVVLGPSIAAAAPSIPQYISAAVADGARTVGHESKKAA